MDDTKTLEVHHGGWLVLVGSGCMTYVWNSEDGKAHRQRVDMAGVEKLARDFENAELVAQVEEWERTWRNIK